MDVIADRIRFLVEEKKMSIAALEHAIGASNGTLSKVVSGIGNRSNVGSRWLEKILITYPDISGEWLLTGRGAMLKEPDLHGQVAESETIYKKRLRPGDILQKELDDIRAEMKEMKENLGAAVEYATKAHSMISELKQELAQQSRQAGRA